MQFVLPRRGVLALLSTIIGLILLLGIQDSPADPDDRSRNRCTRLEPGKIDRSNRPWPGGWQICHDQSARHCHSVAGQPDKRDPLGRGPIDVAERWFDHETGALDCPSRQAGESRGHAAAGQDAAACATHRGANAAPDADSDAGRVHRQRHGSRCRDPVRRRPGSGHPFEREAR